MEPSLKLLITIMPIITSVVTTYVYMRVEAAKMQERFSANKETTEQRIQALQKELDDKKQTLIEVKADLNEHKNHMDKKLDRILDKLDELRRDMTAN